MAKLAKHC